MLTAEIDTDPIAAILTLVRRRAGLIFPAVRLAEVQTTIRRLMAECGARDPGAFLAQVEGEARIFDALVSGLTVGETYFIRDPAQFALIRDRIVPELLERQNAGEPLRFWSAGCASGEEPYSLAILAAQLGLADRVSVLGTDLSSAALAKAQNASYGAWSLRGCDPDLIARHFRAAGNSWSLRSDIAGSVRFERHNLLSSTLPRGLGVPGTADLILCRNVLIYFDADAVGQTARMLAGALAEDGWLITAPADPPLTELAPLEVVATKAGQVYRRKRPKIAAAPRQDTPVPLETRRRPRPPKAGAPPAPAPALPPPGTTDAPADERTALLARVRALADGGNLRGAAAEAAQAAQSYRFDPEVHYLCAILLIGIGRDDEAARSLRQVVYLDRTLAAAHFVLGTVQARSGEPEKASRSFRNTVRLCARQPDGEAVPLADGENAARLAAAARAELTRLGRKGSPPR
jgi:chemotaxis protein methyltransferase CheR